MKKNRTQLLTIATGVAAAGCLAWPVPAFADFFIHSWDNHHAAHELFEFRPELKWFQTSTNYDSSGETFTPNGLDSYHRYLLDLNASYGINPKLTAYARMSWESTNVDTTNPNSFSGTAYGLGDQTLGMNYRIYEKPHSVMLDLQAQIDFPAYSDNNQSTSVPAQSSLGDATTDLSFGGFATLPISEKADSEIRVVGGIAYTYRTKSFSSEIPWSVSAQLVPLREGIVLNGGFFGEYSLKTDSRSTFAPLVNTSQGSLGSGGSYITNAVNPSQVTARGEVGYLTQNDLQFTGSIAQTLWGHEAPNGLTLSLAFQTHFGGAAKKREETDPLFQSTSKYGHSNKGYVNYDVEAKVVRSNDRFQLVKIDKGSDAGIQNGDIFDVFATKPDGTPGSAVARGRITSVKASEAAIKIEEYFREVWIDEGFIARRAIR